MDDLLYTYISLAFRWVNAFIWHIFCEPQTNRVYLLFCGYTYFQQYMYIFMLTKCTQIECEVNGVFNFQFLIVFQIFAHQRLISHQKFIFYEGCNGWMREQTIQLNSA